MGSFPFEIRELTVLPPDNCPTVANATQVDVRSQRTVQSQLDGHVQDPFDCQQLPTVVHRWRGSAAGERYAAPQLASLDSERSRG